jgi:cytochrome b6-f complex iron-sulfur subunit
MDRKEFFSKILVGGSILFIAPAVLNSCSKASDPILTPGGLTNGSLTLDLSASTNNALNTVGGFVYSGNIVIIRTSQTNYVALSRTCTHEGCTVSYNSSSKKMICPCHGAQFSTTGSVMQGPATRALTAYPVTVNGTTLTVG